MNIVSENWLFSAIDTYINNHNFPEKMLLRKFELTKKLFDERTERINNKINETENKISQFKSDINDKLSDIGNKINHLKSGLSS